MIVLGWNVRFIAVYLTVLVGVWSPAKKQPARVRAAVWSVNRIGPSAACGGRGGGCGIGRIDVIDCSIFLLTRMAS